MENAISCNDPVEAGRIARKALLKLHSGRWDQIWPGWRTIFSFAMLIQLRLSLRSRKKSLEFIDQALIFGSELYRDNLTSMAGIDRISAAFP